jgi:hypothetical protein
MISGKIRLVCGYHFKIDAMEKIPSPKRKMGCDELGV